jgi:membrane protein
MNWKSIILAVYHSLDDDRVLAVAAGVTFYALLTIFPAIGALGAFLPIHLRYATR